MTIEKMFNTCKEEKITPDQFFYLYCMENGLKYPFQFTKDAKEREENDLTVLSIRRMVANKKVTPFGREILTGTKEKKKEVSITVDPIYSRVVQLVGPRLIPDKFNKETKKKISAAFQDNDGAVLLFMTWLCMWPTNSPDQNAKWNNMFYHVYTNNIRHRVYKPKYSDFFIKVGKKKDIDLGLLVISAYLFIRSYISDDGKAFIPGIPRYIEEWETWYYAAHDACEGRSFEQVCALFSKESPASTVQKTNMGFHMI